MKVAFTLKTLTEGGLCGLDTFLMLEQGWLPGPPSAERAEVFARAFHGYLP